jgi:hypothetical protein
VKPQICNGLRTEIKRVAEDAKNQGAPNFIIEDTVGEMISGDAVFCNGCGDYEKCFFPEPETEVEVKP